MLLGRDGHVQACSHCLVSDLEDRFPDTAVHILIWWFYRSITSMEWSFSLFRMREILSVEMLVMESATWLEVIALRWCCSIIFL